jgi:hypothetical protein
MTGACLLCYIEPSSFSRPDSSPFCTRSLARKDWQMFLPYRAKNPPERFPYVTLGLIAANTLIYAATSEYFLFVRRGVVQDFAVSHEHFTLARLFSAMFLHGDPLHLIGNMLFLWLFRVERRGAAEAVQVRGRVPRGRTGGRRVAGFGDGTDRAQAVRAGRVRAQSWGWRARIFTCFPTRPCAASGCTSARAWSSGRHAG